MTNATSKTRKQEQEQLLAQEQEWVPVADLRVDHSYQRPLDINRVRRMARVFDPDSVGTFEVSRRADDSLWILDGQHRQALIQEIGWGDQRVPCLVHVGLTLEDEARIFRIRNATAVKPNAYALFKAALTERDPVALDIDRTVRRCGLQVAAGPGNGNIVAVSAVQRIYANAGGLNLERTLRTIVAAWGSSSTNFQADLIVAVALMFKRYGGDLNQERLSKAMSKTTPDAIYARARSAKVLGGSAAHSGRLWSFTIPTILVNEYNKGLRSNALPEWEARTHSSEMWR